MSSLQPGPKRKFKVLDWIVIFLTADMMTTFLFSAIAGSMVAVVFVGVTTLSWSLYEGFVAHQIKEGLRD